MNTTELVISRALQKIANKSSFNDELNKKSELDAIRSLRSNRGGKIPENVPQWVRGALTTTITPPQVGLSALGIELVANIIGRYLGKKAPVRSADEQSSYEQKAKIANWLLPGVASYRRARSNKYYDELEKKYFESK